MDLISLKPTLSRRQAPSTQIPFLALAPEIRNNIYSHVFADIQKVGLPLTKERNSISKKLKRKLLPRSKRAPHLSLRQTCRQVYCETLGYLHGSCAAAINSREGFGWYFLAVWLGLARKQQLKALDIFDPSLRFVTHLKLRGSYSLTFMLAPEKAMKEAAEKSRSCNLRTRTIAKESQTALKMRAAMPNVTLITLEIDDRQLPLCHPYKIPEQWVMDVAAEGWIETAFPSIAKVMVLDEGVGLFEGVREESEGGSEWQMRPL